MSSKENVDEKELTDVDTLADSSSIQFNKTQSTISPPIKSPTEKFASHYNMNRKGLAIIFNHETFSTSLNLETRSGTNRDNENLKKTLQSLGFTVRECQNLTSKQIELTLQAVAKKNHTDYDCLIVCILSYGDLNILYAHDKSYRADSIWSYFTSSKNNKYNENDEEKEKEEKTFTFIGKPKLFFIQACPVRLVYPRRLIAKTEGFTITDSITSPKNIFRLPNHADFLIAYSTMPGYYSWSKSEHGSWFIEALCKVLNQFGMEYDLLTLLTSVCRCVQKEYEINTIDDEMSPKDSKKEVPYITSMLTRLLKFKAAKSDVEN